MKYDEETIKYLEERDNKLRELESMINQMQSSINNNDNTTERYCRDEITLEELFDKTSDIKMEIFRLWYFNWTGNKYDL